MNDPLVRRCLHNRENLFDLLGRTSAKETGFGEWYRYVRTRGDTAIWPNRVYGLAAPPASPEPQAARLAEDMRTGKLPPEVCVEQIGALPRWNAAMEAAGLRLRLDFPSMAVAVNDCRHKNAVTHLDPILKPVRSEADLQAWASLIALGWWNGGEGHTQRLMEAMRSFLSGDGSTSLWLAEVNGAPVATGMLHISGDVAGVYLIFVNEAHRNHGLGGYMTAQMVKLGEQRDCRRAILQATAQGEPVYRRLGFAEVYRIRLYCLPPQQ